MPRSPGNYRLNGLYPLAYMGVNPPSPSDLTIRSQPPTINDSQNFQLGAQWLVPTTTPEQYWVLVNLEQGVATWVQLYPATSAGDVFPTDSGIATPAGGILNILGGTNINTSAPGPANTVQVNLNNNISLSGTLTLSGYGPGVLQVPFIAGPVFSSAGTDGQVLIGATVGNAAWANVIGGTGITIANAANSITVNLSTPVSIANGGTNATSMTTTDGVVYYDGTRLVTTTAGTSGQVLTSNGAGVAPTYQASGGTNPAATCTFFYYQATDANNVLGGAVPVPYDLGSSVALTSLYDNSGGAASPGNGAGTAASLTAPATGVYSFQIASLTQDNGISNKSCASYATVTGTSAGIYYQGTSSVAGSLLTLNYFSAIIPMTIGDVAVFSLFVADNLADPATASVLGNGSIYGLASSGFRTWVSGSRLV